MQYNVRGRKFVEYINRIFAVVETGSMSTVLTKEQYKL